jgi:hypothetical protein
MSYHDRRTHRIKKFDSASRIFIAFTDTFDILVL